MADGDEPALVVLVEGDRGVLVCRVADLAWLGNEPGTRRADLSAIDALARLHLAAVRAGRSIRVRDCSGELCSLLDLVGLSDLFDEPGPPERAVPGQSSR